MAEGPEVDGGGLHHPVTEPTAPPAVPSFRQPTTPRARIESFFARLIATAGVIGIGTAVGAIMGVADVSSWTVGLVVSAVSVVLAAVLWRARRQGG